MPPDTTPDHDLARHEFHPADDLRGDRPEPTYWTMGNLVVIVLGFALAFGLALLVLRP